MKFTSSAAIFACALVLSVFMSVFCAPLFSQTANGRILGTVKDQTGGAIVGATITVVDTARGIERAITTDQEGAYLAPNLIPGTYTVRAEFKGFRLYERQNVVVEVGKDVAVDVVMQPGEQTQKITVTEALPLIETTNATLGGTLSNESINDLPISGRNYQNLLELRPGVVLQLGNNSDGGGPAATNGLRAEESNAYMIEGLAGKDPYEGQSVINTIGVNGDAASLLPLDAIQEFNQQFNPKAAYGYSAGSTVSVGLKAGTNNLHGTAYGFFRNSALDAQNYFNPAGVEINDNVRQFGATVGGPIKKDKLFFFAGYEQMNLTVGNPTSIQAVFTDPSMLNCSGAGATFNCTAKKGLFPNIQGGTANPDASNHFILACLAVPLANRSPQSLFMLGLDANCQPQANYPNPNFFPAHGATDHGAQAPNNPTINTMFPNNDTDVLALGSLAKIDYQANARNSINGFFYRGFGERHDGLGSQPSDRYRTDFLQYPEMIAGTWTFLKSSNVVNSVRVGYSMLNQPDYGLDEELGLTAAQLGLNTGVTTPGQLGLPQAITLTGFYSLGSRESDFQGPGRSTEITEQVSYLRGQHNFMFGGTLIYDHQSGDINAFGKGSFIFGRAASGNALGSGVVSFIEGQNAVPASLGGLTFTASPTGLDSAELLYGNAFADTRRQNWGFFAQDDWRVRPRVTLNLGVRYDLSTVIKTDQNNLSNFDPNLAGGLAQVGNQTASLYGGDHNNFSPRVGVAWDMRGNGKTVIRAGGSIIYELITLRSFLEVGNGLGLTGNPTGWIVGCSTAVTPTIPVGASSNCPGTLTTPGGNQNVGAIIWSRAGGQLVGNSGACAPATNCSPVLWDRPSPDSTTIFPSSAILNCNPNILTRVNTTSNGIPGAPCGIAALDKNLKTPYVETYTFSIQQAITSNLVLDVAYVGNHGVKELDKVNLNQPLPGAGWTTAAITACNNNGTTSACQNPSTNVGTSLRPYFAKFPWMGDITQMSNRDTSRYNGLQVTMTARNFHGLYLVSGYTWSHAFSFADANNGGFGVDAYNHQLDYGPSTQDLRHHFTLSPTYNIPGRNGALGLLEGWKLNANFKYQTGRPLTFTSTTDFQGTGRGTSRWNIFGDPGDFQFDYAANVGNVRNPKLPQFYAACSDAMTTPGNFACTTLPAGINPRTGLAYTQSDLAVNNPQCTAHAASLATLRAFGCWVAGGAALTPPALGTYGNAGKDLFRGLPFWGLDMSMTKVQKFTERLSAEFRAEVFNILNHPGFGQPSGTIGSCTTSSCGFGTITNTPDVAATNPILGQGGPRRLQLGVKIIF